MILQIIHLLLCAIVVHGTEKTEEPIVELPNGKIRGFNRGHYLSFQSIPYAEPTIGLNRFEAPKPYSHNWTDIRDATQPPARCIQWDHFIFEEDRLSGVEDCLTLNVYTPSLSSDISYPVLVVLHPGAFMFGSAREISADFPMENGNIIVVTINYRLGPLGFLSTGDDVLPVNFGLKDQSLAFEWIKNNVALFNGNPEKITLLGFSAGAASVQIHMLNKNFEKFAKSAISMSGSALAFWAIQKEPEKTAVALAKFLGCPTESSEAIKTCLQNKEAADIVRSVREFQKNNIGYNPVLVFGPVIESNTVINPILTESPELIIKSGKTAEIPWLTGFAKDDGIFNAADFMRKDSNGLEMIRILNERWHELAPKNLFFTNVVDESDMKEYTESIKQKYIGKENFTTENYFKLQKMFTDLLYADSIKKSLILHKEYTHSPVYGYVYDNPPPSNFGYVLSNRTDINFGTGHSDDFNLIFNAPGVDKESFTESQKAMSEKLIDMVRNFCMNGKLQFGSCEFVENSAKTKGIFVMFLTKDSCRPVSVNELP